jgi:hypothetical protein
VTTLDPFLPESLKLDAATPDILLFDLDTTHTEAVFSVQKTNPSFLLIGISPDINLVQIRSGWQLRELSMQNLLELIKSEINNLPVKSGGD